MCRIYNSLDSYSPLGDKGRAWVEEVGRLLRLSACLRSLPGNFVQYRVSSPKLLALKENLDPMPAQQLFERHLQGEDHSDQLFRWLVLSKRCREAALA